jgi:hypothetical protein
MQPDLAFSLALDQDPVVVPTRQEVTAKRRLVEVCLLADRTPIEQASCLRDGLAYVHHHLARELKVIADRLDELEAWELEPPKGGAKASAGPFLGGVDPEDAGNVEPRQWSIAERQKGKQTLGAASQ